MNDAREILGQWIEEHDQLRVTIEQLRRLIDLPDHAADDQLPAHIRDAFRDAGLFVVNDDATEAFPTTWADASAVIAFQLMRDAGQLQGGVTFDEVARIGTLK